MNIYFKIFLTVIILIVSFSLDTLGYYFLRMSDSIFNMLGVLTITASSLGAFWCLHAMYVKPINPDDKITFGEKENKSKQ